MDRMRTYGRWLVLAGASVAIVVLAAAPKVRY